MKKLTVKQFKLWLVQNELNQGQVAEILSMHPQTITGYKQNEFFPVLFCFALQGIEATRTIKEGL